jgi:hypothetical protein
MEQSHFGIEALLICAMGLFVAACAAGPSRVYPPIDQDAGSLRVAEVMAVATAEEIRASGEHYQNLLAAGIKDADLRDGSLVTTRVYCCGGSIESSSGPWVYVPPDITAAVGDVIEIRMGRSPSKNLPGQVNTAVSIRSRGIPNESCQWVPDNPALWMRVIYCDWMFKEGWQERGGLYKTWWKPATSANATSQ